MLGKFASALAARLHAMSLEGMQDDECGDVQLVGYWAALFKAEKCVLIEDEYGFVDVCEFDNDEDCEKCWAVQLKGCEDMGDAE